MSSQFNEELSGEVTLNSYWNGIPKTMDPLWKAAPKEGNFAEVSVTYTNGKTLTLRFQNESIIWARDGTLRYNLNDVIDSNQTT